MYTLTWRNPALDANKGTAIQVPVGTIVSNKASLRFTGKGAANYGTIQQENLMRLLENFADPSPPAYPTLGQLWYDTNAKNLVVCSSTSPVTWKSVGGIQVSATAPTPASLGDMWVQKTGSSSVILYIYTGLGRYPVTNNTIGGWEQVWPSPTLIAGREEYDAAAALVNQLIGPTTDGGNGALGKSITNVTNFTALDASLRAAFVARTPNDPFVLVPTTDSQAELLVDPNSQDWDTLLAAAKYAIDRLELPVSFSDDISPVPFVSDGRSAASSLLGLATTNPRYPSLERRSNRKFGIITLSRLYTETMNVLQTAVSNRWTLKGINGNTGTNTSFGSTVQTSTHVQVYGLQGGATQTQTGIKFNFASQAALESFVNSGGAIQLTMFMTGGSTTADTNMKNLLDARGVVRINADKSRTYGSALPLALTVAPTNVGFRTPSIGASASWINYITSQAATANCEIRITRDSVSAFTVSALFTTATAMQGYITVRYEVIKDTETYLAPAVTPVFSGPNAFQAADKTGASLYVVGSAPNAPPAPAPGPAPAPAPTPVAAPTLNIIAGGGSPVTAGNNVSFVVGSYTGQIDVIQLASGPGTTLNYAFTNGNIFYNGPVYLNQAGPISMTVYNQAGSATSSANLAVNSASFTLTPTSQTFPINQAIASFTAPRKTVLTSPDNGISSNGSIVSGAIPPGTTLLYNQGGNGDVVISGTPNTAGTYTFTLSVNDYGFSSNSPKISPTITVAVQGAQLYETRGVGLLNPSATRNQALVYGTNAPVLAHFADSFYSGSAAYQAPTLTATVVGGSLPPGTSMQYVSSNNEYVLVGTPTTAGTYPVQIRLIGVSSRGNSYDQTYSATITVSN